MIRISTATLCEIDDILREEANILARVLDDNVLKDLPPRVETAVRTEMERLRNLTSEIAAEVEARTRSELQS